MIDHETNIRNLLLAEQRTAEEWRKAATHAENMRIIRSYTASAELAFADWLETERPVIDCLRERLLAQDEFTCIRARPSAAFGAALEAVRGMKGEGE